MPLSDLNLLDLAGIIVLQKEKSLYPIPSLASQSLYFHQ